MRIGVLSVLLVVLGALACKGQKVGVKATLSWSGLYYMQQIGIQFLEADLSSLPIPEIDGSTGTPIGTIDYTLSSIQITSISIPQSNVTLVPGNSVALSITDVSVTLTLDWSYREESWPHVSDSGTADVSMSSTTMDVQITIGEEGGRATATADSCDVSIGSLDITLHGGASWLYNIFINLFSGQIQSSTQSALQSAVISSINQGLNKTLTSLAVIQPINHFIELDYTLAAPPTVTPYYFTLESLGEFYSTQSPTETPYYPVSMPDEVMDIMAQIFVSEFTFNSASYSLYEDQIMEYTVTDSMLPSSAPLRLNTTYFTELIPALEKTYPDQMFDLFIYATTAPEATFDSSGASVTGLGAINIVILPQEVVAFTLGVKVLCSGEATMNGNNITGKLGFLNATLWLANTTIGQFDVSVLQSIVDLLVTSAVIPTGNKLLETGFPLPSVDGLSFTSPTVGWGQGYLYVGTDVQYTPPSLAEEEEAENKGAEKIAIV